MGFLPTNFELAMLFHSQLMVRHRTDRQTDGYRCIKKKVIQIQVMKSIIS